MKPVLISLMCIQIYEQIYENFIIVVFQWQESQKIVYIHYIVVSVKIKNTRNEAYSELNYYSDLVQST